MPNPGLFDWLVCLQIYPQIKYWRREFKETESHLIKLQRGTEPHGLIVGLVPNTFYWVRVMAYNQAGAGPESERFLGNWIYAVFVGAVTTYKLLWWQEIIKF